MSEIYAQSTLLIMKPDSSRQKTILEQQGFQDINKGNLRNRSAASYVLDKLKRDYQEKASIDLGNYLQ